MEDVKEMTSALGELRDFCKQDWDPLENQDISGNILKYLGVKDLLKASLVSKKWYTTIGSSMEFKKRVTVYVDENDKSKPRRDVRRLINLFFISSVMADDLKWIRRFSWKKVDVEEAVFTNVNEFSCFLKALGPAVETMTLYCIGFLSSIGSFEEISFPALTTLKLEMLSYQAFKPLIATHEKLHSIFIDYFGLFKSPSLNTLTLDMLRINICSIVGKNPGITNLRIQWPPMVPNMIWVERKLLKLKLETLHFTIEKENEEQCLKFLTLQRDHLRQFSLKMSIGNLTNVWNTPKNLQLLSMDIETRDALPKENYELKRFESITHLSLDSNLKEFPHKVFNEILSAAPNLEFLFILNMTEKLVKIIASLKNSKLKSISFNRIVDRAALKKVLPKIELKNESYDMFRQAARQRLNFPNF
jgi:F-box domain